jgi:hypothetical protein
MKTAAPQLDYALSRRRRLPRALIGIAIALVLAIPVYRYGPPLVRSITLRHHYARAAAYTAPPDQVIYDSNNAEQFKPSVWPGLTNAFRMAPPAVSHSLLFLHSRTTSGGEERLLILESDPRPNGEVNICVTALAPVPLTARAFSPRWATWYVPLRHHLGLPSGQPVRLHAATPDPADRSRFTFGLDLNGRRVNVLAQLTDEPSHFDSVSLKLDLDVAGPPPGDR